MNPSLARLGVDPAFALGVAAIYTPPGGGTLLPCRILLRGEDETFEAPGGSHFAGGARFIDVRASEVLQPQDGGAFQMIDPAGQPIGTALRVDGTPLTKDAFGLVWACRVPV